MCVYPFSSHLVILNLKKKCCCENQHEKSMLYNRRMRLNRTLTPSKISFVLFLLVYLYFLIAFTDPLWHTPPKYLAILIGKVGKVGPLNTTTALKVRNAQRNTQSIFTLRESTPCCYVIKILYVWMIFISLRHQ